MPFSGSLSELTPPELFQLVSLTRKTGKLIMTHGDRQGVVIFRQGKIIFAASDDLRSTLCQALAEGRLAADATLLEEVKRKFPGSTTDSGSFIVQFRESTAGQLEDMVRQQLERTVRELIKWTTGRFVFDDLEIPEGEDIALDTRWFVLEGGVDSNELLLGALTKLDESQREDWKREIEQATAAEPDEPTQPRLKSEISAAFEVLVDESTGEISWAPLQSYGAQPDRHFKNLRRLMGEMNKLQGMSPSVTAEVTLLILRYAAQVVSRGVLFAVREGSAQGIGQFGLRFPAESADERVRSLEIPLDGSSILSLVADSGQTFLGRVPESAWNSHLIERLGGSNSSEVVVVPLVVDGTVVALLYGDNLPHASAVGTVDGLEILMHEIGLGVEKARLELELSSLDSEDPEANESSREH
jgi:hypothetical protein